MEEQFRKTKGFTLVELLVVISIIALLLAVLLPALNKAREQARRIVCAKHEQQLGLASMTYLNDYQHFPFWYDLGGGSYFIYDGSRQTGNAVAGLYLKWINHGLIFSNKYAASAKIYYCPTNEKAGVKYDEYFAGDKLLSFRENSIVRCSYICRVYDVINNKALEVTAEASSTGSGKKLKLSNLLKRPDSKLAILSDTFTYGRSGHLKRFYNVIYADGHIKAFDDHDEYLIASADYNKVGGAGGFSYKKSYDDAYRYAEQKYGMSLVHDDNNGDTKADAWPLGWLFLDTR